MAKSIDRISDDFKKYLKKASKRELKEASIEIFNGVVEGTPVDTGAARQAWKIENKSKDEVRITNDVGYLEVLENGSSQQAPQGFVKQTLAIVEDRRKR